MRVFRGVAIGGARAGQSFEGNTTRHGEYFWQPGFKINGRDAGEGFWMPEGATMTWAVQEILRVYAMTRGGRA